MLLVLFSACINGCARPKPIQLSIYNTQHTLEHKQLTPPSSGQSNITTAKIVNPFQDLIISLMLDSLDLLPKNIGNKYFDVIMKGIVIPVQDDVIEKSVLTSQREEDVAFIAGLIAQTVYGKKVRNEYLIPQAILFTHEDKISYADLSLAASKLTTSQNRYMDAYNASLNLLVNTLSANKSLKQATKNGLYLRDANNNLYFHRAFQHGELDIVRKK